jgi:hypothetical protein
MSFEKFESPTEPPEELGEKKEEFEAREKGDTFPTLGHFKLELAADLELLKNGHIRPLKGPKENPWDKDAEVDMAALVKIMEGHAKAFSSAKEKEDALVEGTNLPDKIEMERGMEAKLASVEKTLRERNLLPDDFDKKKSSTSPASVIFEADAAGGAFTPDKENPTIMIGGRLSRMFGSRVQETAKKFNVEISEGEAVDLAMTFFTAHEWGHYLNFFENSSPEDLKEDRPDAWSTRANEVRQDIDWITDKFDRLPAFHEWVCQSIGDQVLQAELEKKGISLEVATQIKDLFTEDPDDIVGSYRQLAEWADERQLPTYRVINAVSSAARELREAGREDLASQIGGSFHFVGYCLKPLEKSELEYVLTGKRDNARFGA